ncbi:MAG: hypothetical protein BZ138_00535 [Methanosphaera sp. rholeuAM270]|nr:MAG: hypothetical protein BZ138_00535 [Methanosphaera sp. rholeuAM270]
MAKTFIALFSEKTRKDEFIRYFSKRAYKTNSETVVLVGDKQILTLISSIRQYCQKTYNIQPKFNVLILQNLHNTDYLFERFKFKIKEFPDDEIIINIRYGSPKVSAIALIISKLYGLKVQDKRIIEDMSKPKKFEIFEKDTENRRPVYYVKKLFNNYDYKMAREILFDNFHPMDKTEKMFSQIIDIYDKWDSFDYQQYDFQEIEQYFSRLENIKANREAIEKLVNKNHKKHNTYQLADLLNNAKRRIEQEKYDDAVIRLYRALEFIGEMELQEKHGMRKTDIKVDDINNLDIDSSSKYNIKKRMDYKYPRYQIPLTTTFFILQKSHDRVGTYYARYKQQYQELFMNRNLSVLVHGNHKYTIDEIKNMLRWVISLAWVYDKHIYKAMEQLEFPKFEI